MEIREVPIKKLNPAKYNPRKDLKPSDPEYIQLEKSIKEFGNVDPIIWNEKTGNIVGGHQRFKVLSQGLNGKDKLAVSVVKLPERKEKMLNIALNKISGDWDLPRLEDLIGELNIDGFDLDLIGFDSDELSNMFDLEPKQGLTDDDAIPEVDEEPITKPGDLYLLGSHRLLCGDATVKADVERLMDGKKADMVFTDPPYGIGLDTDWSGAKSKSKFYTEKGCKGQGGKYKKIHGDEYNFDPNHIFTFFNYCNEIFLWGADYYSGKLLNKDKGSWLVWDKRSNDDTDIRHINQSDKMFGSCFELCWSKNRHRREMARVKWAGIFGTETEPDIDKSRKHPSQKPVKLSIWFIEKYSDTKHIIIDLYAGAGFVFIACEKTDRICYGMEIEPIYCDVTVKRWEDYTGKKAELCK